MAQTDYAFIKDSDVVNIAIFDDPTPELLNHFKEIHQIDDIVIATTKAAVGGIYDGTKFWLPQPYPSWIKNEETNEWEAPIAYPNDGENYIWDENTTSWLLLPPSN